MKRPLTTAALDEQRTRGAIVPETAKPSMHRPIMKPEIKPDPVLEHEMKLDKHAKSTSTLKGSASRRSVAKDQQSRVSKMFDAGKSDLGTAVGDSPEQNKNIDDVTATKENLAGNATYDDINMGASQTFADNQSKKSLLANE